MKKSFILLIFLGIIFAVGSICPPPALGCDDCERELAKLRVEWVKRKIESKKKKQEAERKIEKGSKNKGGISSEKNNTIN